MIQWQLPFHHPTNAILGFFRNSLVLVLFLEKYFSTKFLVSKILCYYCSRSWEKKGHFELFTVPGTSGYIYQKIACVEGEGQWITLHCGVRLNTLNFSDFSSKFALGLSVYLHMLMPLSCHLVPSTLDSFHSYEN